MSKKNLFGKKSESIAGLTGLIKFRKGIANGAVIPTKCVQCGRECGRWNVRCKQCDKHPKSVI